MPLFLIVGKAVYCPAQIMNVFYPVLFMLLIQVRCKASKEADIVFYFKAFATQQMA